MFHHEDRFGSGFFLGIVVAGALGTMAALLFTTKQGRQLQGVAADKFSDLEEIAKDLLKRKRKKDSSKKTP